MRRRSDIPTTRSLADMLGVGVRWWHDAAAKRLRWVGPDGASHTLLDDRDGGGGGGGTGDVVGPASATAGAPAVFDGTTGKLIKQLVGEGVLGLVSGVLTKITTTLGDLVYGGASGTPTRLAGNTTTTLKVLTQTGDGANSAAPAWTAVSGLTVGTASNPGVLKLGASGGAYPYDAIGEYQYTAAGSNAVTIPTGATWCDIEIQGNGGPGGGGRRGAASSNRGAGGGGAAGGRVWRRFSVAELLALGSTLTLTIAAQASGGAGATTDSTNGSAGTAAAANTAAIGATTILTAPSGAAGVAGTTSSGTGGVATSWVYTGGDGGAGSTSAAVVGGTAMVAAGGGGGGGGISNTNSRVGGAAGGVGDYAMDLASGPAGGSSAGSAGTSATGRSVLASGSGGGGGAAGDTAGTVPGGVGGDGVGGGGGGGGGGATNGANGGNGGKGGVGWIRVVFT